MLRLRKLSVIRFRRVLPTELSFSPDFNIPLGRNASGKTTLLKIIRCALLGSFSDLLNEDFSFSYVLEAGDLQLNVTVNNAINPQAHALESPQQPFPPPPFHCSFEIVVLRAKARWISLKVGLGIVELTVDQLPVELPSIFADIARGGELRDVFVNAVIMGLQKHAQRVTMIGEVFGVFARDVALLDESLDAFWAMMGVPVAQSATEAQGELRLLRPRRAMEIILLGKGKGARAAQSNNVPAYMGEAVSRAYSSRVESERANVPVASKELPFLARAAHMMGFKNASMNARQLGSAEDRADVARFSRFSFDFARTSGSFVGHEFLSFGQKRLLAFLFNLDRNPDVVIADELVNGLHYEWIEECIKDMKARQKFLTSQNPLLLDFLTFKNESEVSDTFILCSVDPETEALTWRNINAEESANFFRAYSAGIQHVGEILRDKKLW